MAKTGKVTRKGKRSSMRELSPDDPLFKRGFVVGGQTRIPFSNDTPGDTRREAQRTEPEEAKQIENEPLEETGGTVLPGTEAYEMIKSYWMTRRVEQLRGELPDHSEQQVDYIAYWEWYGNYESEDAQFVVSEDTEDPLLQEAIRWYRDLE